MEKRLTNQNNVLKIGLAIMILINCSFFFFSFTKVNLRERFEEINAERINIIGVGGKPVMTISNKRLIPGVSVNGKTYPKEFSDGREFYSGIIFFNEQGDEVGGLIYNGWPKEDSGYFAIEHLSFDQWKQNQVVAMQYIDNGNSRRAGLRVWDRPDNVTMDEIFDRFMARNQAPANSALRDSISREIQASRDRGDNGVERMFIGSQNEVAQIQIRDSKGNIRIKMYVDEKDQARLEFLDEDGVVTETLGRDSH